MTNLFYVFLVLIAIGMIQSVSVKNPGQKLGCLFLLGVIAFVVIVSIAYPLTPEREGFAQRNYAVFQATATFESHCQWQWQHEWNKWRCIDWDKVDWAAQGLKHP